MRSFLLPFLARVAPLWLSCGHLFSQAAPLRAPSGVEPGLEEAVKWKWSVAPSGSKEWGQPLPEAPKPAPAPEPAPAPAPPPAPAPKPADALPANPPATPPAADDPNAPTPSQEMEVKPGPVPAAPENVRPATYEVKRGDGLIRIAQSFGMTSAQLKKFNDLKNDRIVIGQVLRIPTAEELLALQPPPPPPAAEKKAPVAPELKPKPGGKGKSKSGKGKDGKSNGTPAAPRVLSPEQLGQEGIVRQVFLDREGFSAGGINGKEGGLFEQITGVYLQAHPEIPGQMGLTTKALAEIKEPFTSYTLRAEDFKFIKPREAVAPPPAPEPEPPPPAPKSRSGKKGAKAAPPAPPKPKPVVPPLTYDELAAAPFLSYTSAWEFVAERFHCDEAYLHRLNPALGEKPAAGDQFRVPNVIPFEIEKALDQPLQPAADPQKPVTAAVEKDALKNSLLKITREGQLIAVMPMAFARPGLRGRGTWTMLDAIPAPRLTTKREPRETSKTTPAPAGSATAAPAATPAGAPATAPSAPEQPAQFLASGPNNPAGIFWIQLGKRPVANKSAEPLPYGLHGTSIPAKMQTLEGIGGLRLTNWDIARAVRLLPAGTPLEWMPEKK